MSSESQCDRNATATRMTRRLGDEEAAADEDEREDELVESARSACPPGRTCRPIGMLARVSRVWSAMHAPV